MLHGLFFPEGRTVLAAWGPARVTAEGLGFALEAGTRTAACVLVLLLFSFTVHVPDLVAALTARRVPRQFSYVLASTLTLVPAIARRLDRIRQAQQARGLVLRGGLPSRLAAVRLQMVPLVLGLIEDAGQPLPGAGRPRLCPAGTPDKLPDPARIRRRSAGSAPQPCCWRQRPSCSAWRLPGRERGSIMNCSAAERRHHRLHLPRRGRPGAASAPAERGRRNPDSRSGRVRKRQIHPGQAPRRLAPARGRGHPARPPDPRPAACWSSGADPLIRGSTPPPGPSAWPTSRRTRQQCSPP